MRQLAFVASSGGMMRHGTIVVPCRHPPATAARRRVRQDFLFHLPAFHLATRQAFLQLVFRAAGFPLPAFPWLFDLVGGDNRAAVCPKGVAGQPSRVVSGWRAVTRRRLGGGRCGHGGGRAPGRRRQRNRTRLQGRRRSRSKASTQGRPCNRQAYTKPVRLSASATSAGSIDATAGKCRANDNRRITGMTCVAGKILVVLLTSNETATILVLVGWQHQRPARASNPL